MENMLRLATRLADGIGLQWPNLLGFGGSFGCKTFYLGLPAWLSSSLMSPIGSLGFHYLTPSGTIRDLNWVDLVSRGPGSPISKPRERLGADAGSLH